MTFIPPFAAHYRASDKQWQTLDSHLLGVAKLASRFAAKLELATYGELLGLLHDFGKYSHEFQAYLKSATGAFNQDEDEEWVDSDSLRGKVDHSTAGAQLLWQELSKRGLLGQIVGQIFALCVASHHSGLINCLTADINSTGEDAFTKRTSKADSRTHLNEALDKADESILSNARALLARPEMLTAMKMAIGKIVRFAPDRNDKGIVAQQQIGLLVRILFSCLIDADRIDTADFESPKQAGMRMLGNL